VINFMVRFGSVAAELNRLLRMRFSSGVGSKSPIGRSLAAILYYQNQGDYIQSNCELGKMTLLANQLKEIERYDPDLLKVFRGKIRKSVRRDQFFGVRLEVNIAVTLFRSGAEFIRGESPDFIIHRENESIFIECGSAHLSRARPPGDLKYKIGSVINQKSKKKYCGHSTALCIDTTSVYYNSLINETLLEKGEIRAYVTKALQTVTFGSVIVFTYVFNVRTNAFESGYIRIDGVNVDRTLVNLLNECFPMGEYTLHDFLIPSEV